MTEFFLAFLSQAVKPSEKTPQITFISEIGHIEKPEELIILLAT